MVSQRQRTVTGLSKEWREGVPGGPVVKVLCFPLGGRGPILARAAEIPRFLAHMPCGSARKLK